MFGALLDAIKLAVVYFINLWFAPQIEKLNLPPFADVSVELGIVLLTLFVTTLAVNTFFALPKVEVIWSDLDEVVLTGTDLTVKGSGGMYPLKVRYECSSSLARAISQYWIKKKAKLVVSLPAAGVSVTASGEMTRERNKTKRGIVILSLSDPTISGDKAWCDVGLEPKKTPSDYKGAIEYRMTGQGRAMVISGFLIRPKSSVKHLQISRSLNVNANQGSNHVHSGDVESGS